MEIPSLSVIIPNFNHGHCIAGALDAFLTQTVKPKEIIVVDDASTDDSVIVVETYAKRDPIIRLLRNEKNLGTHPAANRGIVCASGQYVHITASDDRVLPGFVEKSLRVLSCYPQAGLCWSDNMTYDVEKKVFNPNKLRLCDSPCYFSPEEVMDGLRRNYIACFSGHSSVIRRLALIEAGMLIPELHWHADGFTPTIVALRYGACYVPEVLMCAEMSPQSYMRRGASQKDKRREVLNRMLELAKEPEYSDVYLAIKKSGFLGWFDFPALYRALLNPRHWDYLTVSFLRKVVWIGVKKGISNISPYFAKAAYHRIRDYYRGHIRKGLKSPSLERAT